MSLKSFLTHIWIFIQKLFNSFPADLKIAVETGVVITENLKTIIDSPVIDVLTAIIPGNLDDKIKKGLRVSIPVILTNLKLTNQSSNVKDPNQIIRNAAEMLKTLDGDIKSAFLHNLSILIAQCAADGKLSWSDGAYVLEWFYQQKFKANNHS